MTESDLRVLCNGAVRSRQANRIVAMGPGPISDPEMARRVVSHRWNGYRMRQAALRWAGESVSRYTTQLERID